MLRRSFVVAVLIGLLASPAFAQARVEASFFAGWTASEGVSMTNAAPINGSVYDRVDPKGAGSWGFTFGAYATEQMEIEFLFSQQSSSLEVTGGGPMIAGDMKVYNYHGNFIYNFFEYDRVVRPFLFIGLGATSYGEAKFPVTTIPGLTKFSWGLGGGIKAYPSPHLGFKVMGRWTPTYIKTDGYGWWCDPYWGCGAVGNAQYANQFEMSGGLLMRF